MNKQTECVKSLWALLIVILFTLLCSPFSLAKIPDSKTEEQLILEEKEAAEQAVKADESLPSPVTVAVQNLPEDTTPRFTLSRIEFTGNLLLSDETLLANIPDVFNASPKGPVETFNLYDLRPLQAIAATPGTEQSVSARSIEGFTQFILSKYQDRNYAGIYVYIPREAFESGGALEQGILTVRVLEAPVTKVSSAYGPPSKRAR